MDTSSACPSHFYFCLPSAILTFWVDPQRPLALPVRWWGMVCGAPSKLSLAVASRLVREENFSALRNFGLSLVGRAFSQSPTFQQSVETQNFDLLLASSAAWYAGNLTGVPLLKGTCFQAECRDAEMTTCDDTIIIQGEAAALHVREKTFGPVPPVNLCNFPQFGLQEDDLAPPDFGMNVDCEGLNGYS